MSEFYREAVPGAAPEGQPEVPPGQGAAAYVAPQQPTNDHSDDDWSRPRRTSRLSIGLAALVIFGLGVTGGIVASKTFAGTSSNSANPGLGIPGQGGFLPGEGRPSGSGRAGGPGGFGGFGGGAEAVAGSIASLGADSITVTTAAGKVVTVKVGATTTVMTAGVAGLTVGLKVSVVGTTASDGTVTAQLVRGAGVTFGVPGDRRSQRPGGAQPTGAASGQ